MNHEAQLELQASLDGELSASEAQKVEQWLSRDPEARTLLAELRQTKRLIACGEVERQVPATREFYWSQIERRLTPAVDAPRHASPATLLFRIGKWLVPATAAALLAAWLAAPLSRPTPQGSEEIETALSDASCITFHSEAEGLTVVWVDSSGR